MSGGWACRCGARLLWRVVQRHERCSAFDGYRPRCSQYSEVLCLWCGRIWRSKGKYVAQLPDLEGSEKAVYQQFGNLKDIPRDVLQSSARIAQLVLACQKKGITIDQKKLQELHDAIGDNHAED